MHRLIRALALVALALLPAGCDWCQMPGSWQIVSTGMVRDASGAELGEARLALAGSGRVARASDGSLSIEMIGPAALAGTAPGWPAGGRLQGWVGTVRLVSAGGVELGRWRPRVGSERMVFERISDHLGADEPFAIVRHGLLNGGLVLEVNVLDHPQAPPVSPGRGTVGRGDVGEWDGTCT